MTELFPFVHRSVTGRRYGYDVPTTAPEIWVAGRYQILRSLGAGGLGEVFYAHDRELDRGVAIKRLFQDSAWSNDKTRDAWREARVLASLTHPGIVTLYDFGSDEEGPYFIMEYIDGRTLEEILQDGAVPENDCLELARQGLEALGAAHEVGIVHRDLKPSNLMVRPSNNRRIHLKVLDFGLARFQHAPREQTVSDEGTVLGSVIYMAPEQFDRRPVDARSDLYAFGQVLYHALAGVPVFQCDSIHAMIAAHLHERAIPLSERAPHVHPGIGAWVDRLIAKNPSDRPANAGEALASLEMAHQTDTIEFPLRAAPVQGALPAMTEWNSSPAPQKNNHGLWIAAATVVLAAAIGITVFLAGGGSEGATPAVAPAVPTPPAAAWIKTWSPGWRFRHSSNAYQAVLY